MDAKLKRKMLVVAAIHLALSFICWLRVPFDLVWLHYPTGYYFRSGALGDTELNTLFVLQPSILLPFAFNEPTLLGNMFWGVSQSFLSVLFSLSMPLWSICFAWLFVKLDNWLNHFPVLGRKVF
jgi:hypothetical protein